MNGMTRIRKFAAGAGACFIALTVGSMLQAQQAPSEKTTWSGIYTEVQATRGAAAYAENCQTCHGATMGGTGEAPAVAGSEFLSNWNGLTLGELFDRIRTTMPFDRPTSLSRDKYTDILAYMLKFNGFPSGQTELDRRSEVLATIRIASLPPTALQDMPKMPAGMGGPGMLGFAARALPSPAHPADPNGYPNPYRRIENFLRLPTGRTMGSTSAVAVDSRGHIWVVDRCGANSCADSDLDPIMEFDAKGRFIKAFGRNRFLFPHGFTIDRHDRLWLTDGHAATGKGFQVFELDRDGRVLRTLGKAGVAGDGPDAFNEPNAVLVAPNGSIFVADGHTADVGNARIMKFTREGQFVTQWGTHGSGPGQLNVPHALAMDSRGRLFVADRWNNRIQIYDQTGVLLDSWSQFGRPSGLHIDKRDMLYVADSESRTTEGYGHHPGWRRGIRIGSARTGVVSAFIPNTDVDPDRNGTSGAEGIWVDDKGVIYGAQVRPRSVVRYEK